MSFCYKKILGVFTHLRVTTPNIIEPLRFREWDISRFDLCPIFVFYFQTFYENILKFSVYLI